MQSPGKHWHEVAQLANDCVISAAKFDRRDIEPLTAMR